MVKAIAGLWFHRKHRFNKDRLAAVQSEYPQFKLADFYRLREKRVLREMGFMAIARPIEEQS